MKPDDLLATEVGDPRSTSRDAQAKVTALCDLAYQVREESEQLAGLRDTLLPHLMSGTLRVRDAEKQVEAVV